MFEQEAKAYNAYPFVVAWQKDDFRKYFLAASSAGVACLEFVNLNRALRKKKEFIKPLAIMSDTVDFKKSILPIIIAQFNKFYNQVVEVWDSSINKHRRILIRMDYYIPDSIEKQDATQTNIHSGKPCPCCHIDRAQLLAIDQQYPIRSVTEAWNAFQNIHQHSDLKLREEMIKYEQNNSGYIFGDTTKYIEELTEYKEKSGKKRKTFSDPVYNQLQQNPFLEMKQKSFDVFWSTPVEPFHLICLNLCKIFLNSLVSEVSEVQKKEMEAKFKSYKQKGLPKLSAFKYFADWKANEFLEFLIFLSFEGENYLTTNWQECLELFLNFLEYVLRPYIIKSEWKQGKMYENGLFVKYKRFFEKFKILVIDSKLDEYEQKITLHMVCHLFECLCFGHLPLIWAKKYEHKIGALKKGNISGPKGIIAMGNMDCRKSMIWKIFEEYKKEEYHGFVKCDVGAFVCIELAEKIQYGKICSFEKEMCQIIIAKSIEQQTLQKFLVTLESEPIQIHRSNIIYVCFYDEEHHLFSKIYYGG